jgi:dethiobiotin synthetase
MSGFFITGTDTEVGKTLIATAIIYQLQERGLQTCGFKPVVAGMTTVGSHCFFEDLESLLLVSNHNRPQDDQLTTNDICPYHLPIPAAPHIVAKDQGISLDLDVMVKAYELLTSTHESVVVEGAGGFLVPISETQTLANFAAQIRLPVIMVVDIRLGCINHALLTALAIRHHQLTLVGWVANCTSYPDAYTEKNIKTLSTILKEQFNAELLGVIPFQDDIQSPYSLDLIQRTSTLIKLINI